MVSVGAFTPEIFPSFTRVIDPFFTHWKFSELPAAVTLKLAGVPTLLVTLTGWLVIEGGVFVFETKTVKALVALIGGTPLSVTTVAIKLVVKAWALLGVQVITPLPSIAAPAGGEINW